ncbi:unnamed protein product [Phytophthora fragariaefolia]|uniref:Unnamed protein product n=1 Tax=Phytophthora fragariaefolia TaxID=1490495 RepID=A0A9W6YDS5_9STRA|nr:unnamed protein product [Phytophthora fragariaefolia]
MKSVTSSVCNPEIAPRGQDYENPQARANRSSGIGVYTEGETQLISSICRAGFTPLRRDCHSHVHDSKFLRFQELEVEIEECQTEIGRLRAKLETTTGSPTVAGKLKVSSVPVTTNSTGGLVKNTRLEPIDMVADDSPDNRMSGGTPNSLAASRVLSSRSSSGQVRVVPLTKYDHREGFVSKTRRRALEAEYYKQVRLAQLEVECELEENLHIRAAREAKKLQAIDHSIRHVNFEADSARSQQEAAEVSSGMSNPAESPSTGDVDTDEPTHACEDPTPPNDVKQIAGQQKDNGMKSADPQLPEQLTEPGSGDQRAVNSIQFGETHDNDAQASNKTSIQYSGTDNGENGKSNYRNNLVSKEDNDQAHSKQKTYEDDEFNASDEDSKSNEPGPTHNVWNLDPSSQHSYHRKEISAHSDFRGENGSERSIWNVIPNIAVSGTSADDSVPINVDNPSEAIQHQEKSVSSEDINTHNVWNLDPNRSAPTTEALVATNDSSDVHNKLDEEANIIDHTEERNVWNLDPNPSAPTTEALVTANDSSDVHNKLDEEANIIDHTEERNVWNLDPNPSAPTTEALVTANDSSDVHNKLDEEANIIDHTEERNVWNLDPNPSAPTTEALVTANDSSDVHNKLDEEANIIDHTEERNVWNLDPNPSAPTTEALVTANDSSDVHNKLDEEANIIDHTEERNVWNLDPNPSAPTTEALVTANDSSDLLLPQMTLPMCTIN